MAHMYPEELPNYIRLDPKRAAEVAFYDALRLQLGAGWVVFYSVAWLGVLRHDNSPQDGETDFIVAHPVHGVLLLEVKGGRITYDGERGTWTTQDSIGDIHDISPFAQVRKCKYALLETLKAAPLWRERWITLGHAVAFPHATHSSDWLPPDAPSDIILYADDLTRLHRRLREIMDFWNGNEGTEKHRAELVAELQRRLAPTTTLPNPLALQVVAEERELLRLTEEQFRTLDLLRRTRRAAISGCAGSGKTMLAAEKARRLSQEGFRTLLVCTSLPLAEHLDQVLSGLDHVHVRTFAELCSDAAEEAGLPKPTTEDGPQMLSAAMTVRPTLRFDAVLVDEGQNLDDLSWLALEDCIHHSGIFYVFYDDNQRVANPEGNIPSDLQPITLCENVRNTRTISHALQPFYRGESNLWARGPAGRALETFSYQTVSELSALLGRALNRLVVSEGVPAADIVLLTPHALSTSSLPDAMLANGFELVIGPSKSHRQIQVASVADFQGLERAVVLVAELDETFRIQTSAQDALWYVALSRARNHLLIFGSPQVLERISQ